MPSLRCPRCIQRLPVDHDFHLCPARRPQPEPAPRVERSDHVHHAAILREAGVPWAQIAVTLGRPANALQVAVHRRGWHHR